MEYQILGIIEDLLDGFKKRGYTDLSRKIASKLRLYKRRRQENRDEGKKEAEARSRTLLTKVLETIVLYLEMSTGKAENQLRMLDSIEEVFQEFDLELDQIEIDDETNRRNLSEFRDQYTKLVNIWPSLRTLIARAKEEGYIDKSDILDGVLE